MPPVPTPEMWPQRPDGWVARQPNPCARLACLFAYFTDRNGTAAIGRERPVPDISSAEPTDQSAQHSPHRRDDKLGAFLGAGGPARRHGLGLGVEADRIRAVL